MKKIILRILVAVIVVGAAAGFLIYHYGSNFNLYVIPPSPQKYGKIALERMEDNGLYTDSKAWEKAKNTATEEIKHAKSYDETIPALEKALKVAGGEHSFIYDPGEKASGGEKVKMPTATLEEDILYLTVPAFSGSQKQANQYANILADAIAKNNYKRIVVDLSDNTGGDMSPMISGLSALLPDGELMHFADRRGNKIPVTLEKGKVSAGGAAIDLKQQRKVKNVPIAVIIGGNTGSSGEITALAFKGMKNVKYFGKPTYGFTSGNSQFQLYDGRQLMLTTMKIIDRTKTAYLNKKITPDVTTDRAKEEAVQWLKRKV